MEVADARRRWGLFSFGALLFLAAGPAAILIRYAGAPARVVAAGAITWAISIAVKHVTAVGLVRVTTDRPPGLRAAAHGTLSAALELTAAALYLRTWPAAPFAVIAAFGTGAGSAEVLYVLGAGIVAPRDPEREERWAASAARSLCVRYMVPIERAAALAGHVGARGLLYVGITHGGWPAAALVASAVSLFAMIDGVAYYGHQRQWDWFDPRICHRAHGFFTTLSLLELALFAWSFDALR